METRKATIFAVLQKSDRPLTANEISKRLELTKKEVNQVIYNIDGVVKEPDTQPPQWRLKDNGKQQRIQDSEIEKDSTNVPGRRSESSISGSAEVHQKDEASLGASPPGPSTPLHSSSGTDSSPDISAGTPNGCPSDAELKEQIKKILQISSPQSAPEIQRKLQLRPDKGFVVKRMLYDMEKKGDVENTSIPGQKPLWKLKQVAIGNRQAKFGNKPLYTLEEAGNGALTFNPVDAKKLIDSETERSPKYGQEAPLQSHPRMLECVDGADIGLPGTRGDKSKTPVQGDCDRESPVQSCPSTKKKSRLKLAANFVTAVDSVLEEHVLKLLQSCPHHSFTCDDVREKLGEETRDKALACLRDLVKKKLVLEEKSSDKGGSSKFRIRSQ